MAAGKRKKERQEELWVATTELARSPGHPFYERVNRLLDEPGFDEFVEELCAKFYAGNVGRPGLTPGVYVRMLLIGYFEGIDSERGIAWQCADSLALRSFLGLTPSESPPDHSTVSRTRRLIDLETHVEIFSFVLKLLAERGLAGGKTIGVDATTLEANAAMKSLVRRDTGQSYDEFLTELAKASGIETPTREDLARIARKRAKKGSNDDWHNPHDPDAEITKLKDGRTHLSHKAEHSVDMDSGAIMAATIQPGATGDTTTVHETMMATVQSVATLRRDPGLELEGALAEWVMDKGYHSNEVLVAIESLGQRGYIAEPKRGRRRWRGKEDAKHAVYANRRRIKGRRGRPTHAPSRGDTRAPLRSLSRDRRSPPSLPTRPREHREALPDPRRSLQPRHPHEVPLREGHSTRSPGLRGGGYSRASVGNRDYPHPTLRLGLNDRIRPRIPMGSRRVSTSRVTPAFTTGC